ncbi:group II intron reverse transcriptase/maturase [Ottowia caeni]|uniref:group II intron reverse transcriptase/maturase n=1 Tax=Ottowia caeni TaxID=2870339 RepID=UPI003D74C807
MGKWVDREIWTDRMLAALVTASREGKRLRWHSLIDKVWRERTLHKAWKQVRRRGGAAGIDGVSIARFEAQAERYLSELAEQLKTGSYLPEPVRRVEIPKADGSRRPLGIPAVKDRVVQTALKSVIEPIFESGFDVSSYGFRPGRGCKDALREVSALLRQGNTHVVDVDFKSFFDTIPPDKLLARVAEHISDTKVLALIDGWLHQDIVKELQRWTPTGGTPQGAVISPLLANIYLNPLDALLREKGWSMVRYADDFVVLCPSASEAQKALAAIEQWVHDHGLELNMDKTTIGNCRTRRGAFEFLGYRLTQRRREVRPKSLEKLKDAIRARTMRTRSGTLAMIIESLNRVLRGWFNYFQHASKETFGRLDAFVRRRLRAVLRRRTKGHGAGQCWEDGWRWPPAYFAQQGLFAMHAARVAASQSR